ncbi:MAG: CDP-alcohol phosphatidyltransferase family protein [Polyangiaceae bacterium]
MSGELEYKVEDRSILLPYYKRWVVEPFVKHVPASVHPNSITHVGHLINFAGAALLLFTRPTSGWQFFVTAFAVQLYNWCDNADGTHARRTNQCSPEGEFLDHGLDVLNVGYIALMTALSMGMPVEWWLAVVLVIQSGASFTYWEQTTTGVFRVGMLNQVEALSVLSITLIVSGIFGTDLWSTPLVSTFTPRHGMLLWVISTLLFGMARGMVRVTADVGFSAIGSVAPLIVFQIALAVAAALGAIGPEASVALCVGANVHFGLQMLSSRMRSTQPVIDPVLSLAAGVVVLVVVGHVTGYDVPKNLAAPLLLVACGIFGIGAVIHARHARAGLRRLA